MKQFEIQNHPDFDNHESVVFTSTDDLTALIAVHNTSLGAAVGGCRMFPYDSHSDALKDVLRLSRGMTYKSALAGLPLGGGKAVIIGDPQKDKNRELLLAMGEFVDSLNGRYVTAEDSGTSVGDIATIGERTRFVSGVLDSDQHGGDPSPMTALGVLIGIRQAVSHRCQTDLKGIRVAIQGVGNVGYHLTRMLVDAGAQVTVADVREDNLKRVQSEMDVDIVSVERILSAEVDVLSPCALGGAINESTVNGVRAGIVAGAANNQLATPDIGQALLDRGILYAPDYVINRHIEKIGSTLASVFRLSDEQCRPTGRVADEMAEQIFMKADKEVA